MRTQRINTEIAHSKAVISEYEAKLIEAKKIKAHKSIIALYTNTIKVEREYIAGLTKLV